MAHGVLDVVTEDPEEPHIPYQVHPAAMQEHVGQHRSPVRRIGNNAISMRPDGDTRAQFECPQQSTRYQSERTDRARKRGLGTQALQRQPGKRIEGDDADGDIGRQKMRIVVTERNHGLYRVWIMRLLNVSEFSTNLD